MKRNTLSAALGGALLLTSSFSASAIQIVLDYSYDTGFFAEQARRDLLQTAVDSLGSRLSDNLSAITSSGSNNFDAAFSDPSTGGSATQTGYSVAGDTMVVFIGSRDLGSSTLGLGGPGGFGASGSSAFIDTVLGRGQSGALDATPSDFGPWGGAISFNSASNWYFDTDLSTSTDIVGNDFYSVALHEMGHVLGLGTAGSWDALVSGSDIIGADMGTVALNGDLAHFANGTLSTVNGVSQEAAMSSSITTGTRKEFTDLDYAALSDIGWQVTPVPVPAAVWLFTSGLLGLFAAARRRA